MYIRLFLPDPETGGDSYRGEGKILGEIQVEVWPGPAGSLALGKPTMRSPLFPKILRKCHWMALAWRLCTGKSHI